MFMIKGLSIDTVMHIRDTTTGMKSILVMIIMCIAIQIIYNVILIIWYNKKVEKLRKYQFLLKKKQKGIKQKTTLVHKVKNNTLSEDFPSDNEYEEAMQVFNTLR